MGRLCDRCLKVNLHILYNEASAEYRCQITKDWKCDYQLVPPNIHRRNALECSVRTFKAHFLSILAGVAPDYPLNIWGLLLPQTELTLNLIHQATLDPTILAWEYFQYPSNYDTTPIGPLGCNFIINKKTPTRNSWDFCGSAAWIIGVSLKH